MQITKGGRWPWQITRHIKTLLSFSTLTQIKLLVSTSWMWCRHIYPLTQWTKMPLSAQKVLLSVKDAGFSSIFLRSPATEIRLWKILDLQWRWICAPQTKNIKPSRQRSLFCSSCLVKQWQGQRGGRGMILKRVTFCQTAQSVWDQHLAPEGESWFYHGTSLCIGWTAWCSLVLQPPRIYQTHMPDSLGEEKCFSLKYGCFFVTEQAK